MKIFRKKQKEQMYTQKEVYDMLDELLNDISDKLIETWCVEDAYNYAINEIYRLLKTFHKMEK